MDVQSAKRIRQASSISNDQLMVSDPLCYVFTKFKQLPYTLFKQLISDFYPADTICEDKNILLSYMEQLDLSKWTKPLRRRKESVDKTGHNLKAETDDRYRCLFI